MQTTKTIKQKANDNSFFGTEKIWKLMLKLAPPVMLAQLIQSLYNITDSYFVGQFSPEGVTALSIVYPLQLLIMALAIGTGVGVNTAMAKFYGLNEPKKAGKTAGTGVIIAIISWLVFAVISVIFMKPYVYASANSQTVREYTITYSNLICIFSLGIFLESIFTKVHQAKGDMKIPMLAQVSGAITNIILDPILIFGKFGIPPMGITGAAIATIIGQFIAAAITFSGGFYLPPRFRHILKYIKTIYKLGVPNIIMQALYTVYIAGLNFVLVKFCDEAVSVLGIYYKLQSFFFIPLLALETCVVPLLSYNYVINKKRCKEIMNFTFLFSFILMSIGIFAFEVFPTQLISIFVTETKTLEIGAVAFRLIALSFWPAVFSLMHPFFFQAIGMGLKSIILTVLRQVILFVPVAYALSFFGLNYVWATFPITEIITATTGIILYERTVKNF